MKTILLILMCIFTLNLNAQSYECQDDIHTHFNIVITENSYNLVIDSFIIITKLDTIIEDSLYTQYVPLNSFRDTLTIYKDSYLSFTGNGVKTTFTIIRELEPWEEQILFNKRLIALQND